MGTTYKRIDFDKEVEALENKLYNDEIMEDVQIEEENVVTFSNGNLSEKEKREIADRTLAMSDDELLVSLKVIKSEHLWNELKRRYFKMKEKTCEVESILGVFVSDINPIGDSAWDGMIKRYSDVEERFTKIAKGFGVKNEN